MAFKFVALAALVAVVNAGHIYQAPLAYQTQQAHLAYPEPLTYAHPAPLAYAAPVAKAFVTKTVDTEFDPNPAYKYEYSVSDSLTGDSKNQQETRNGDVVEGSYSLTEADGSRRTVKYTADDVNGFNAVVEKEPAAPALVKTVAAAPVAYHAAPVAHAYAAPVAHAYAPVAHAYAAPVAHQYTQTLYHH